MQKILLIRFSSIGDIVLTTPVIRCLHEQLPDAEIHVLTREKYYKILQANPHIHKIHLFRDDLKSVISSLKETDFDFIVDLHKNIRSLRVKKALHKPSGTFDKLNIKKWLLVNFKINKLPDIHIVDRYFQAVRSLGVHNDGKGLDYFIPPEDMLSHADLPDNFPQEFVAIVIGGNHNTKMLPEESLIRLCDHINSPIVLFGGPEDNARAERIISACEKPVFNACGLFNINQSAALIKMANKVITNDTGLMHIAAAFHKEIVSIWGNTIPGFGMYPYLPAGKGSSVIMEVKGLSCRPCSKIGYDNCPKKHFRCMKDIPLDRIAQTVNE